MRAAQVERHLVVGGAVDVEPERVGELALVVIGRAEPDDHLVALADLLAVQFGVGGGGAPEVHRDGAPAQHLLHGSLDHGAVAVDARLAQLGELVGPFGQRLQPGSHRVAGGVVAGTDHQHEEVLELEVGDGFAVDGWLEQLADHIVRRAGPALVGLGLGVAVQVERRGRAEGDVLELVGVGEAYRVLGHLRVEVAQQRVAALDQPVAVAVGHAQQAAEHAHRQLLGHAIDELEAVALLASLEHHAAGQLADGLLVAVHLTAAERLAHQAPVAGVLGRVVLEHVAAQFEVVALDLFQGDALGAAEQFDVLAHVQQVGVAGDGPEALAAIVFGPPADGLVVAQPLERGVREAVQVRVGVDDVEVVGAEHHVAVAVEVGAAAHACCSNVVPPANVVPTWRK